MEKPKKKIIKKVAAKELKDKACPTGCCSPDKCCCKNKTFSFLMVIAAAIIIFTFGTCVGINLEHEKGDCARIKNTVESSRTANPGCIMRNSLQNSLPATTTTSTTVTNSPAVIK